MHRCAGATEGTETSKYLEEEKTRVIPQVVASERGRAQTEGNLGVAGLNVGAERLVEWSGKADQRG